MPREDFDSTCLDTADHFLQDDPPDLPAIEQQHRRRSLAVAIQQAVEDWFTDHALPPAAASSATTEAR